MAGTAVKDMTVHLVPPTVPHLPPLQAIDAALRHTSLLGERVERGQLLGSRAQKDDFGGHGGRAGGRDGDGLT